MDQKHFPELKTERLFLRRLEQYDWEMISYLRTDKTVNRFVKRSGAETKEKALDFIRRIDEGIDSGGSFYWCLTERDQSEMIGSICLWNFSKDRKKAEVGYDLSPEFQGKGIMNEALCKIVEFGFNTLNLDLIEAYTHRENSSSKKLLERNQFKLMEGKIDKENLDNLLFALKKPVI